MPKNSLPRWDLSRIYAGPDDPKFAADLEKLTALADRFEKKFRGKISAPDLDPATLADALETLENIEILSGELGAFPRVSLDAGAGPDEEKFEKLKTRAEAAVTAAGNKTRFFELEWIGRKSPADADLLKKIPAGFRPYLARLRDAAPHRRPEPEENLAAEKNLTGRRAWIGLFDDLDGNFLVDFEGKNLTTGEILTIASDDPDRARRRAAFETFSQKLSGETKIRARILDAITADAALDARLENFGGEAENARHFENFLERKTVDAMLEACRAGLPIVARWYRLKAKILGLPELAEWDRYAPLRLGEDRAEFGWDDARQLALETFAELGPEARDRTEKMFFENRIDAPPGPGKRGGAYCWSFSGQSGSFVFTNFLGKRTDVSSVIHELGHALHFGLATEAQREFSWWPGYPLGETASYFAEGLFFEKSLRGVADPRVRLDLLGREIEQIFGRVFRQASFTEFERKIHAERARSGALSADFLGETWQAESQKVFGDGLRLSPAHRTFWAAISHFFQTPFYCYAYAFGQLLVFSLLDEFRRTGAEKFTPNYFEFLRSGGSTNPETLARRTFGVELGDPEFWTRGIKIIENLVADAEKTWAEISPDSPAA